ncbi:hypothetical protein LTR10_009685 [Elasticomyces elasticus]|nr:hypothetical protein LTR10_009685 [Elasticomyces elasticus]KAK4969976.1 hypothetical protein LTR42_008143 [Elasticomyces elasticus]
MPFSSGREFAWKSGQVDSLYRVRIKMLRPLALLSVGLALAYAQSSPQCNAATNGSTFDGTAGSEQQYNATTVRSIKAADAVQGVAVDKDYFYSIDNFSITKHNKTTGESLLQWFGGKGGPIIHLDGGVVIDGIIYCPHSNYPQTPITSSVEMWNATTLEHVGSHPFGIYRGSLTWIDQDANGTFWGTFANYDRVQHGQTQPYGLTMNTQLVQFGPDWSVTRSWILPDALWGSFSPMSNSGGSFGPDGWLYITGHDDPAVYVLKVPSAGDIVVWVATISVPDIGGQGIAWDRSEGRNGSLYGISRASTEVVEMKAPLQDCEWNMPAVVGAVYGPGSFIDPEA